MIYTKYLVREGDSFDPEQFPQLMTDIDTIRVAIENLPLSFHTEILFSSFKRQYMKTEWKALNPALAEMISSKTLPTTNIEELFASSIENPSFQNQLEAYIITSLK